MGRTIHPKQVNQREIGAYVADVMSKYVAPDGTEGMTSRGIANATGLAQTTVTNIMSGAIHVGRDTLTFILDVLGVPEGDAKRQIALGLAADRSIHSDYVKAKLLAFYPADHQMVANMRARERGRGVRPAAAVPNTADVTASSRRQVAVDSVIDQLVALTEVGWDDVLDWLMENAKGLTSTQRDALMKAIYS